MKRRVLLVSTALAAAMGLMAAGPAMAGGGKSAQHKPAPSAIENVISPLGFTFAPDGTAYVGEAFLGNLLKVTPSGARSVIANSGDGGFVGGIAVSRGGNLVHYASSLPPEFQEGPPADTTVETVTPSGTSVRSTSLLDYEVANNPDASNLYGIVEEGSCQDAANALADFIGPASYPGQIESNPYAVAADRGGSIVVADAAGNSIVRVSRNGTVSTVAVLPPVAQTLTEDVLAGLLDEINGALEEAAEEPLPADALDDCIGATYESNPVPTDVEIGPHGDYYVSGLPGFPETAGSGSVFRIDRSTGAVTKIATGFTGAVDLAVDNKGTVYVAELFAFQVSVLEPGESTASSSTFVECPTALEFDQRGRLWVAEGGICSDGPPTPGRIRPLNL